MKKLLLIFLLSASISKLFAQQDPLLSQYNNNKFWHNPAFAGAENKKVIGASYRNQWIKFPENPITYILSYDQPLNKINSGVGVILMSNQLGKTQILQASLAYNYKISLSEFASLRLGLQASVIRRTILFLAMAGNPEPNLPKGEQSYIRPDFDFGAWFNLKEFYVGFSAKHLTEPNFINYGTGKLRSHLYATSGYSFSLGNVVKTTPSIIIRYVPASKLIPVIDINNTFVYNDIFMFGTSYRGFSNNSIHRFIINSGVTLFKKLDLMVSYDFPAEQGKVLGPSIETSIRAKF